jgi:hypothetical protein
VNIHILNRLVAAAVVSPVLFVGMSIPANGQQQLQQQAAQQQEVAPDRLPRQPQQQLTQYRQHGEQGLRAEPRNISVKKSRFLVLKSLGGHIKPLPLVPANMSPWQNRL